MDLDIVGTGLGNLITGIILFFAVHFWCTRQDDLKDAVKWPTREAFEWAGIWKYLKIGGPTTVMICLDWWVWELMILISGTFDEHQQAAQIIIMHIVASAYMAAIGLEQASNTIVGYFIGKKDVVKAKVFYREFQLVTCFILLTTSSCIYLFKDFIASLFMKDEKVTTVISSILWMVSFNTFPDGFKGMLKGLIKALNLQAKCALLNIFCHWFINMTLMWYLGIHLGW